MIPEFIEPFPSISQENRVELENDDLPSENDICIESYVSTDPKNIIFCDQKTKKHRSKRLPLVHSIKNRSRE